MTVSAEFLIPLSPNEPMVTQLVVLAASIRMHGGKIAANARIRAFVHQDGDKTPLTGQKKLLDSIGVEINWVEKQAFEKYGYSAGGLGRMCAPLSSDVVVLIDADTLVAGTLDDVLELSHEQDRLLGLTANVPPPYGQTNGNSSETWTRLFAAAGLGEPEFVCEYSGWNKLFFDEIDRYCPPYFNLGFVVAPALLVSRIGRTIFGEFDLARNVFPQHFANAQFALALAVRRLSIDYGILDAEYNFPITHRAFLDVPDDYLKKIKVFHYLGDWEGDLRRGRDFSSLTAVGAFLKRGQVNEKMASFIDALRPVYKRIEFPWLWHGYSVAEEASGLPGDLESRFVQVLEESASWAREHVRTPEIGDSIVIRENNELRSLVDALVGSFSWRITAPVRYLGKALGLRGSRRKESANLAREHIRTPEIDSMLDKENDELRSLVDAMKGSISWRMTAPLRYLGRASGLLGSQRKNQGN